MGPKYKWGREGLAQGDVGRAQSTLPHDFHTLTGQHRALGSGISKVQSLKLDTSVWSNEVVQVRGQRTADERNGQGVSKSRVGVQLGA